MASHERAGQRAQQQDLHNIPLLVANYFQLTPDPQNPAHKVEFGTSGHRGCADKSTFNQHHIERLPSNCRAAPAARDHGATVCG